MKFIHYSTTKGLTSLNPAYAGTGACGEESKRSVKGVWLYPEQHEVEQIVKQVTKTRYLVDIPDNKILTQFSKEFDIICRSVRRYSTSPNWCDIFLREVKHRGYYAYRQIEGYDVTLALIVLEDIKEIGLEVVKCQ